MRILWPVCKEQARDIDHAKAAFMLHCMHDRPWLYLGEEEIIRIVSELE
jgi:hypothetical protein